MFVLIDIFVESLGTNFLYNEYPTKNKINIFFFNFKSLSFTFVFKFFLAYSAENVFKVKGSGSERKAANNQINKINWQVVFEGKAMLKGFDIAFQRSNDIATNVRTET